MSSPFPYKDNWFEVTISAIISEGIYASGQSFYSNASLNASFTLFDEASASTGTLANELFSNSFSEVSGTFLRSEALATRTIVTNHSVYEVGSKNSSTATNGSVTQFSSSSSRNYGYSLGTFVSNSSFSTQSSQSTSITGTRRGRVTNSSTYSWDKIHSVASTYDFYSAIPSTTITSTSTQTGAATSDTTTTSTWSWLIGTAEEIGVSTAGLSSDTPFTYSTTSLGGTHSSVSSSVSTSRFLPLFLNTTLEINNGQHDQVEKQLLWWPKASIQPDYMVPQTGVLSELFDFSDGSTSFSPSESYTFRSATTHRIFINDLNNNFLDGSPWITSQILTTFATYGDISFDSSSSGNSWTLTFTVPSSSWNSSAGSADFYSTTITKGSFGFVKTQSYKSYFHSSAMTTKLTGSIWTTDSILISSHASYSTGATTSLSYLGKVSTTSQRSLGTSSTISWTNWTSASTYGGLHLSGYITDSLSLTASSSTRSSVGTTHRVTQNFRTLIEHSRWQGGRIADFWQNWYQVQYQPDGAVRLWAKGLPNGWFGFGGGFAETSPVFSTISTSQSGESHSSFSQLRISDLAGAEMINPPSSPFGKVSIWATRNEDCLSHSLWGGKFDYSWIDSSGSGVGFTAASIAITFTDTTNTTFLSGGSTIATTTNTFWPATIGVSGNGSISGNFFNEIVAEYGTFGEHPYLIHTTYKLFQNEFVSANQTMSLEWGAWSMTIWTGGDSTDSASFALTITDDYSTYSFDDARGVFLEREPLLVVCGADNGNFMQPSFTAPHYTY